MRTANMKTTKIPSAPALYIRPLPKDLIRHFKAECVKRGHTMVDVQIAFMRECCKFIPLLSVHKRANEDKRKQYVRR